jgi:5,10-methylenetetrahydromethanopterin reductase
MLFRIPCGHGVPEAGSRGAGPRTTHLTDRDRLLLDHIDVKAMIGDAARVGRQLSRLGDAGFAEIIYTPTGPDVPHELRTFVAAHE